MLTDPACDCIDDAVGMNNDGDISNIEDDSDGYISSNDDDSVGDFSNDDD